MKTFRYILLLVGLFSIVSIVPGVHAMEVQTGESVQIAKEQVIDGSVIIGATNITVDGVVHGDVFCAGQRVHITGKVDGDVICAAQSMTISGAVSGNVRLIGQTVEIAGGVRRNASLVAQSFSVSEGASVSGELLFAGQSMIVDGTIGKSILGAAQFANVNGRVNGGVKLDVESLGVGEKASISGGLLYTSDKEAIIPPSAHVAGTVNRTPLPPKSERRKTMFPKVNSKPWPANALSSILFFLIVGLIVVSVFPKYTKRISDQMKATPLATGVTGAIALMTTPVLIVLLAITILGIPIAIALLFVYLFVVIFSRIFVAGIVGAYILENFNVSQKESALVQMLVGVPVLWFMFKAPFVGGLLGFIAVCWAVGGVVQMLRRVKK